MWWSREWLQMTIQRLRFTCWMTKCTNTNSEYLILTVFPRQQWLRERCWVLRCTCIAYFCQLFFIVLLIVGKIRCLGHTMMFSCGSTGLLATLWVKYCKPCTTVFDKSEQNRFLCFELGGFTVRFRFVSSVRLFMLELRGCCSEEYLTYAGSLRNL